MVSISPMIGIAYARWATHYETVRLELTRKGYVFTLGSDIESIAYLVSSMLENEVDLLTAGQSACQRLIGAFAIAVNGQTKPCKVIVSREGSSLLLGFSGTSNYAGDFASAVLQATRDMVYLEIGDIPEMTAASVRAPSQNGMPIECSVPVSWLSVAAVELLPILNVIRLQLLFCYATSVNGGECGYAEESRQVAYGRKMLKKEKQ
jgi:glucosamine--fructose-6-phosphate aminotransferase (isomerizing)